MEGDEEAVADVEDEEAEVGTDLLLAGPETLIFARPGDKVEDVEGKGDNEEGDMGGRVFMACPARRKTIHLVKEVKNNFSLEMPCSR